MGMPKDIPSQAEFMRIVSIAQKMNVSGGVGLRDEFPQSRLLVAFTKNDEMDIAAHTNQQIGCPDQILQTIAWFQWSRRHDDDGIVSESELFTQTPSRRSSRDGQRLSGIGDRFEFDRIDADSFEV